MIGEYFAARPDEIDQELVELGPEARDLAQVAEQWTATDELQLSGWTIDERTRYFVASPDWP